MKHIPFLLTSLIFCTTILHSYGQQNAGTLRQFRCLAWNKKLAMEVEPSYFDGGKQVTIENLSFLQLTSRYKWRGDGVLRMGLKGRPPLEDTPKSEVIRVRFKANHTKCLVIFVPNESEPSGIGALVFDDDPNNFPWGSYRFLNGTGVEVLFQIEKKKKKIPAKPIPIVIDPKLPKQNIRVFMAAENNKEKMLLNTVWPHHPEVRSLVLIIPTERKNYGHVTTRVIEDRKPLPGANVDGEPQEGDGG